MKKFLSICLSIVILTSVAALMSCSLLQNNDDSYKGSAGEYYYTSAQAAIQAYLEEELSGEELAAVYVSHTKEKELTDKEIANLDLVEKYGRTVIGAEQLSVDYVVEGYVDDEWQVVSQKMSRTIYIIAYDDETFRYFATPIKTGETLTTSYLYSLYDTEKYLNCELNSSIKLDMTVSSSDEKRNFGIEMSQNSKFTESAFWYEINAKQIGLDSSDNELSSQMYAWDGEKSLMTAQKTDDKWTVAPAGPYYTKLSDLMQLVFNQAFDGFFDATYFEKTSDGYKIKADKAETWFKDYYNKINAGSNENIEEMLELCKDFQLSYTVTVRNDRISKLDIGVSFTVSRDSQSISLKLSASNVFTNFGKTKVTVPQEVLSLAK